MTDSSKQTADELADQGKADMNTVGEQSTPDTHQANQSETDDPQPAPVNTDAIVDTPPAPVKRRGGFLSLLAILLSLAALAASGYVWWQQEQVASATAQSQSEASGAILTTRQELAALNGRLDENLARLSGIDAGRGRIESHVDDMRSSVETLTARVHGAEQSIDAVRGISASARNNWIRAEAEYYLQAANSRLQLARDPDAALAALEAADDRLKSLGDPSLYRVRQQLADEIAALRAVPRPDMEGIAHQLNGLAARVEQLPLNNASPGSYQAAAGEDESDQTQGAMDRAKATVSRVITSMVSVKRTDEEAKPLLSRDEEFFLKRNLELQLQTARLALLRGEPANYTESLRTARNWVQTHFITDASTVQSAISTLTDLEKVNIAPGLPDISGSLRLLRLSAPQQITTPRQPAARSVVPVEDTPQQPAGNTVNGDTAVAAGDNEDAA